MLETLSLQVEEIASLEHLESLRNEWSGLCDRSPRATPFQRPEWLIPWWRAFSPGEPWVLAVRRGDRLAALAPFLLYRNDGRRTVAFCGGGVSDYCDVVTDPEGEDAAVAALFAQLSARHDRWEVGDFEPIPGDSPLLRADPPEGLDAHTEPLDVCPFLPLPGRVEDLREGVHNRQLANLHKYRRKAEALGDLRLETVDGGPWEPLLETVLRFYEARRRDLGQASLLEGEGLRAFHQEVADGFRARGALALYALCLNGSPIASLYGFREKNTLYSYMQGFDPAWAKLSPGVMVVGGAIEDSIRRGARRIDFLRGREPYKYWWGAQERETFRRSLSPRNQSAS
jgi:CelD/BcsL family acetyltransferase involved in cellulose biosynthesis